jgi:hypothetical protein
VSMGLRDFENCWRYGDTGIDFLPMPRSGLPGRWGDFCSLLTEFRRPFYDFINIPGVAGLGFWALGITELDETALTLRHLLICCWRILLMVYNQIELCNASFSCCALLTLSSAVNPILGLNIKFREQDLALNPFPFLSAI